jgi:hypothetical protein
MSIQFGVQVGALPAIVIVQKKKEHERNPAETE